MEAIMENINENNGTIKISDEVIATITSVAVTEIDGVCGLSGSSIADGIAQKFVKKNSNRGIKVNTVENDTTIDISLVVKYGMRIPEIAWEVQENVKKSVESMSGLNVSKVNIHISGVEFNNDMPDEETEETTDNE